MGRWGSLLLLLATIGEGRPVRARGCKCARVQNLPAFSLLRDAPRAKSRSHNWLRGRGGDARAKGKRERGGTHAQERERWREFGLFPSDAAGLLALLPRAWSRIYAGKKVCFHLFLLILTARAHRSPQPRSSAAPGATGRASVCDHQLSHIERRAALRRTRRSRFRCFGWRVSGAREAVRRRRPIDGGSSSATARA